MTVFHLQFSAVRKSLNLKQGFPECLEKNDITRARRCSITSFLWCCENDSFQVYTSCTYSFIPSCLERCLSAPVNFNMKVFFSMRQKCMDVLAMCN